MKKAIIYILISFSSVAMTAQEKNPMINFEKETIDYGDISKGSEGTRTFVFENTGTAPLLIKGVRSSCGCTIPKKPEDPIAPGEKGEIIVRYDTNRVGVFRKTITVNTNVPTNAMIALKIKGNVLSQ
ncbi:MAG: Uncharacterised protein [Flavobacteriaceae bacterium]|jgi:hypothetical protein|nr:DUF1573 domain-containing protein [Flavobacteriaceae bacterium]MDG1968941.1 DUF1573 domain-containing protein [Flavobacteriaceae bacterium]CAI8209239.1 MAG: Uncharacterised protein [Flavobacteriaceae bacterium]HCZ10437.1 hypothetical protein [Flavobacteriaceae bacterium]